MRFLLLQHAPWVPAMGGASRSNRFLLEGLTRLGHTARVVAPAVRPADEARGPAAARAQLLAELAARGVAPDTSSDALTQFSMNGVQIDALSSASDMRAHLRALIRETAPTHVLVSCDEPFHLGLQVAIEEAPERTVYLARTTTALPFGPASSLPDPGLTRLVAQAGAIVATSDHIRDYVKAHAGLTSTTMHSPLYGDALPPRRSGDGSAVMMINPCTYKGIRIFLDLARRFPDVPFAAVRGWGTTSLDEEAMAAVPNVTVLPHTDDIESVYAAARVLLVPSLWDEAFGAVCVEAMMRAVPVIVSDSGGLPEAALGTALVAPVRPIEGYLQRLDERHLPEAIVPEQDLGPWTDALGWLLDDPGYALDLAERSREAAGAFIERTSIPRYEAFFERCFDRAPGAPIEAAPAPQGDDRLAALSPERLALLAGWVRQRRAASPGGPTAPASAPLDLEAEVSLDASIRPAARRATGLDRVLLTGATGFLGGALLRELLASTTADVHCLVRADSEAAGAERIVRALKQIGTWEEAWRQRLIPELGTLEAPRLGLSEPRFAELAEQVDLVLHNGAQVHFALPYEALRAANVDGTREIVRLACEGKTKPLHFVSTLAVFPAGTSADGGCIDEERPRVPGASLVGGYAQSKWVAEGVVLLAAERGLPVTIHRPAIIGGHSATGAWATGDLVCRLLQSSVQLGAFPDLERPVYMAPVDYVAQGIVALARRGEPGIHHLLNPHPFPLRDLGGWLASAGHPVALVAYDEWLARLGRAGSGPAADFAALLPHMRAFAEDQLFSSPRFEGAVTAAALVDRGVRCPPIDAEGFGRSLAWLAGHGALPAPVTSWA